MFQMQWLKCGFLVLELLLEYVLARRCSDEPEERRRGVQRARAEFRVGLETNKVEVVWVYASVSVGRVEYTNF